MAVVKNKLTRSKFYCPIFGSLNEFNDFNLPTYEDIMKEYLFKQHLNKIESGFEPSVSIIANELVDNLTLIWNKPSIPIVSKRRIKQKFRYYHQKYRNLLKPYKERKDKEDYKEKVRKFREDSKKLFDIAACKCDFKS